MGQQEFHYVKFTVKSRNPVDSVHNYSRKWFIKRYFMRHFGGLSASTLKLAGHDQRLF